MTTGKNLETPGHDAPMSVTASGAFDAGYLSDASLVLDRHGDWRGVSRRTGEDAIGLARVISAPTHPVSAPPSDLHPLKTDANGEFKKPSGRDRFPHS
ncbi:hypothetical protein F444_18814 [Phytophthora nicotianae P1976]|uniref:Uncharacterized protein n=1 Tax=Phytophthora nicotianae P1976 TaxID=1317066 RepID=A0A080ZA24_PHYNI|nr:hypothetical protein F444_18814 [Phytophthora nicotianae P1976]